MRLLTFAILGSCVTLTFSFSFGPICSTRGLTCSTALRVSVGLGPDAEEAKISTEVNKEEDVVIPEPDHEAHRTSRLSEMDKKCDEWFTSLLGSENVDGATSLLGEVSEDALRRLKTLPALERNPIIVKDDENWTPYQTHSLPGSLISPAYGLEQFGIPTPRRNSEAWRHFDLPGLVSTDYSLSPPNNGEQMKDIGNDHLSASLQTYKRILREKGSWLDDEECLGRLVYINGQFVPSLSKTNKFIGNLGPKHFNPNCEKGDTITDTDLPHETVNDEILKCMKRITDGFTDELAAPVPSGETDFLTSFKTLSGPDHNVGDPTSQYAINGQQGTACFVALNSVKAGAVAYIHMPDINISDRKYDDDGNDTIQNNNVLIINAQTANGGIKSIENDKEYQKGVAFHPRSIIIAGENSNLALLQSFVDLDSDDEVDTNFIPKFANSVTQMYVKANATVNHSYLEETGGIVTPGVEDATENNAEQISPREIEAGREALQNTHFETIDIHLTGDNASYDAAIMSIGGNGRSRVSTSTTLLKPGTHAGISGFSLSGGAQRTDFRTLIHHVAQGTTSRQSQRNMVGGRATTSFRGRIRVEQSAQQTDSEQLARTVLLSDKSRIWAIPSLEIIADDVTCTHGATVSDLSEEELFYLRSRGLDRETARNILMFAFVDDIAKYVGEAFQGSGKDDDPSTLKNRVIQRLQNVVPKGDRAIKGEFQSV